ncbi:MAG: cell division protein SepF [Moorea sp. SIO2B7]|nr:cell division protein SepF [Moorena sp. SIO2B7]
MNMILTKLKDFVGLNESEEYEYYQDDMDGDEYQNLYQEEHPPAADEESQNRRRNRERSTMASEVGMTSTTRNNNVIGMPGVTNGISEVLVVDPRSFEEMPQVIQALRERKSVVLNLTMMDPDEAQRAVDFVAGGTYAMDGHQERIGESIFLFTPSCVQVSTQSGVVHEVAASPKASARNPAPTPAWSSEQSRIAQ